MIPRVCPSAFLKPICHGCRGTLPQSPKLAVYPANTAHYSSYSNRDHKPHFPPQQNSIFRSLLGLTGIFGGAAIVVYLNPTVRDYVLETAPYLRPYANQLDTTFAEYKSKLQSAGFPKIPSFGSENKQNDIQSKPLVKRYEEVPYDVNITPSFPSSSDVRRELVGKIPETIRNIDIQTAITDAERAVHEALTDLHYLESAAKRHLDELTGSSARMGFTGPSADKLGSAQRKAKESHHAAQRELAKLRGILDGAKERASEKEKEVLKSAIARYGDLSYDLSGRVNEIRRLQTHLAISSRFTKAGNLDQSKLQDEIKSILPKPLSGKPVMKEDGTEMTIAEVNTLLAMTLERIAKLHESLESSSATAKSHLAASLRAHKEVTDHLIREAVDRAVARELIGHELERFEWDKKSKEITEYEISAALARHGHHLAQMLRLKQEELEHQFDYRLREALAEQKVTIEGDLHLWTRRMEAIEHVVDGRADIDRVTKQTHALWLAVESLACALEMPFSKIGARRGELKPLHTSEPLGRFVEAITDAAGESHDFAGEVVCSLPRQALTDGVWTRQGLLHRFHKVYKISCNVALVNETGGSLWHYAISWLQSKLLFDSMGHRRFFYRFPVLQSTMLTPETEVSEDVDTFVLLASARAALMPECTGDGCVLVDFDPSNCTDIEFAVKLLSQLKGQPASVAADWIEDARRFLEVHQAVQALLAYATAQNISAFDGRL